MLLKGEGSRSPPHPSMASRAGQREDVPALECLIFHSVAQGHILLGAGDVFQNLRTSPHPTSASPDPDPSSSRSYLEFYRRVSTRLLCCFEPCRSAHILAPSPHHHSLIVQPNNGSQTLFALMKLALWNALKGRNSQTDPKMSRVQQKPLTEVLLCGRIIQFRTMSPKFPSFYSRMMIKVSLLDANMAHFHDVSHTFPSCRKYLFFSFQMELLSPSHLSSETRSHISYKKHRTRYTTFVLHSLDSHQSLKLSYFELQRFFPPLVYETLEFEFICRNSQKSATHS